MHGGAVSEELLVCVYFGSENSPQWDVFEHESVKSPNLFPYLLHIYVYTFFERRGIHNFCYVLKEACDTKEGGNETCVW